MMDLVSKVDTGEDEYRYLSDGRAGGLSEILPDDGSGLKVDSGEAEYLMDEPVVAAHLLLLLCHPKADKAFLIC
jgi:hypothetical protein